MFAYVDNNPINRIDDRGALWDTILDVIGIGNDIADFARKPSWSKAGWLAADLGLALVPFVPNTGAVKAGAKVVNGVSKVDDVSNAAKASKTVTKIHGNSLKTTKMAEGYQLIDRNTGTVLKYGETTRGLKRYSQKYLDSKNADMIMIESGSKYDMHQWQHNMIIDYRNANGKRPDMNLSDW